MKKQQSREGTIPFRSPWLHSKSRSYNVPLTRIATLLPLVAHLRALGSPIQRLLRLARIPESALEDPETPVPLYLTLRFADLVSRSEGIPNLGPLIGQRTALEDLGVFGHLLKRSVTVQDYLTRGIRYVGTLNSVARFHLSTDGDQATFSYYSAAGTSPGRIHDDLFAMTVTINTIRKQAGARWAPIELRVPGIAPENAQLLAAEGPLAGTKIVADTRHACFVFSRSVLALPFSEALVGGKSQQNMAALPTVPLALGLHGSITQIIELLLPGGYPGLDLVAEAAGMSERTLQRRLAAIGMSYSETVDETRMVLARRWLEKTEMPIGAIAAGLGYTNASNFARAFRRRAGISPREYRRGLTIGEESSRD